MKPSVVQKPFVSPFLFSIFLAVGVTGTLLFFHVKNGPIVVIHEWLGMAFVVAGLIHILLNFRTLLAYFKTRQCWVATLAAVLLIALFAIAGFNHGEGRHGPHGSPDSVEAESR